jgi:hypothetical protein
MAPETLHGLELLFEGIVVATELSKHFTEGTFAESGPLSERIKSTSSSFTTSTSLYKILVLFSTGCKSYN